MGFFDFFKRKKPVGQEDERGEANQEKGLTAKELADMLGKSLQHLNSIIHGHSGQSINSLQMVADALGVPIWQLFEGSTSPSEDGSDLVAFIRSKGQLYQASTIEELEALVGQMKKGEEGG